MPLYETHNLTNRQHPEPNDDGNTDDDVAERAHLPSGILMAGFLGLLKVFAEPEGKEKTGEERIIQMVKLAKLCHQRKEYKKSEQFLHLALRAAYEIQHHQATRYIIDEMANNAYEIGDLHKAEKLFKETMKQLLSDGMPPGDNAIVHISAKLANLYGIFNDEVRAREGFKFCISQLEAKINEGADDFDTLALYSLILCWFGEYIYNHGKLEESLELFRKAHDISVRINGAHHPHSLLQLNNMAASLTLLNRIDEAVDCLKSALALVQEHQIDEGENDLPYYYINLTNIYLTQLDSNKRLNLARFNFGLSSRLEQLLKDETSEADATFLLSKLENPRDLVLH
nr:EOG090X06TI [Macrothrix elegans]